MTKLDLIVDAKRWHVLDPCDDGICVACNQAFPCETIQLADELDAAWTENERLWEVLEHADDVLSATSFVGGILGVARDIRAALDRAPSDG